MGRISIAGRTARSVCTVQLHSLTPYKWRAPQPQNIILFHGPLLQLATATREGHVRASLRTSDDSARWQARLPRPAHGVLCLRAAFVSSSWPAPTLRPSCASSSLVRPVTLITRPPNTGVGSQTASRHSDVNTIGYYFLDLRVWRPLIGNGFALITGRFVMPTRSSSTVRTTYPSSHSSKLSRFHFRLSK